MIQAGFARVDVTPPLGAELAGYFEKRYAKGVLDPVELNALAFSDGQSTALLIACDVTGMNAECCLELRERICARTGVATDHILLCSLHQHTSFRVGELMHAVPAWRDGTFLDVLYRKFADVAQMALNDMSDATVGYAAREALAPLSFTRRYRMEDGSVVTNPSGKTQRPLCRCDESDNTVRLLRFAREGREDIALVQFSTHADVIGGQRVSADWPGFVRRFVEKMLPDTGCVCIVGCQGDSNHIDFLKPKEDRFPEGSGYAHSRYMGRVIAQTVAALWADTVPVGAQRVFGEVVTVYNKTNTAGLECVEECRAQYAEYEAGRVPSCKNHPYVRRIAKLREAPIFQQIPVTVLGIGNVALVGFGGEPFTAYAGAAEAVAGGKHVITACLANGNEGYLVTDAAFREGGYEATNTNFTPGVQADCIAAAAEMLKKF